MSPDDFSDFAAAGDETVQRVRTALKRKRKFRVETIADELDISPRRVRDALDKLRLSGYRIPEEVDGQVEHERVKPAPADAIHKLPLELLDGERVRFGVVSDTHLGSKHCALPELHLAYDYFEREGITRVLHGGDIVDGVGIYAGHHNELAQHTFEDQVDHAVSDYPARDGIETILIGGNHDLEGDFGRAGADPCVGISNKRPDITYIGAYSAYLELANGAHVHMLHGKGGGSYAVSYKMQKRCEAYPAGRKPAALIFGHFHVELCMQARGIQGIFPGCFQWSAPQFGERLGLTPAVGFHVVECCIAQDGVITDWAPRWKPIYEGRVLA